MAALSRLIGEIYDAAFDPGLWHGTVQRLADAVGGAQVMMGVHDFAHGAIQVVAPRMDPEHLQSYRERWWTGDRLWQRTNAEPIGKVLRAESFVPRTELEQGAFYNEWYRRLDLGAAGLGVNLDVQHGVPALCGIKRARGAGAFTSQQEALFTALVPHLVRAARIHRQTWELNLATGLASVGIAAADRAVLALDLRGRVVYANTMASDWLSRGDGLTLSGGRLSATCPESDGRLATQLNLVPMLKQTPAACHCVPIRCSDDTMVSLQFLPLPSAPVQHGVMAGWPGTSMPAALVLLHDPRAERRRRRHLLQAQFHLTDAEVETALEIVCGDGRAEAARRLGVSTGTLRIHLQRVFDKTGVHRQAELVRLVDAL